MAAPSVKQRAVTLKRQGFGDSVIGAILGVSPEDVRSLMVEADPIVVVPGASRSLEVRDVLIPSGTDLSVNPHTLGSFFMPAPYNGPALTFLYLQVSEAPAEDVTLAVPAIATQLTLGPENGSPGVWRFFQGVLSPDDSVFETLQVGPLELEVQLEGEGPTSADITVELARAAFVCF